MIRLSSKRSLPVVFAGVFSLFVIVVITTDHSILYNKTRKLSSSDSAVLPADTMDVLPVVTVRPSTSFSHEEVISALYSGNTNMYLVESESPFFLCSVPKTGCSLFKMLATKANGGPNLFLKIEKHQRTKAHIHPVIQNHDLRNLDKERAKDLLSKLPRVLITRNPYERHLSAYFDFLARNRKKLEEEKKSISFEEYTTMVSTKNFKSYFFAWDHHAQSISTVSRYKDTNYNYVFRLEEMDLWFPTFVKDFGLEKTIEEIHADGTDFYKQNTDPDAVPISQREFEVFGKRPWKGIRPETKHQHDSANQMFEYYTPELARIVFNLFRKDFEHFGYPAWDGNPATFHYV